MKLPTILATTVLIIQFVGCAHRRADGDSGDAFILERPNLQYRAVDGVDSKYHSLDLYAPKQATALPIMIYVHGGGWATGDKRAIGKKAEWFTAKGFLFVSVNYQLVPEGRHPNNVQDVAHAIQWVRLNAVNYGGDPKTLFLMGHSAGAHLVSLVATNPAYLKDAGASLEAISGIISLDTQAYDVPQIVANSRAKLYVRAFGEKEEAQKDASPIHQINKGSGIPPFLICYSRGMGMRRSPVRRLAAKAFFAALKTAGIHAEMVDASDRNHREINQRFGTSDDIVTQRAMTFLARCLGSSGAVR